MLCEHAVHDGPFNELKNVRHWASSASGKTMTGARVGEFVVVGPVGARVGALLGENVDGVG